jgi:hypothetical protein
MHERSIQKIKEKCEEVIKEIERRKLNKQAGRPSTKGGWVAKSLTKPISLDTTGYSQARQRLPIEAFDLIFKASTDSGDIYSFPLNFDPFFSTKLTHLKIIFFFTILHSITISLNNESIAVLDFAF